MTYLPGSCHKLLFELAGIPFTLAMEHSRARRLNALSNLRVRQSVHIATCTLQHLVNQGRDLLRMARCHVALRKDRSQVPSK